MSDPYRVLSVPTHANDETIRAAYLAALRMYPPEHYPESFENIRTAYEAISTERARLAHALFDPRLPTPADILALLEAEFQPGPPDEQCLNRLLLGAQ